MSQAQVVGPVVWPAPSRDGGPRPKPHEEQPGAGRRSGGGVQPRALVRRGLPHDRRALRTHGAQAVAIDGLPPVQHHHERRAHRGRRPPSMPKAGRHLCGRTSCHSGIAWRSGRSPSSRDRATAPAKRCAEGAAPVAPGTTDATSSRCACTTCASRSGWPSTDEWVVDADPELYHQVQRSSP